MPASRSARKGLKLGKSASAHELRLREEMGLDPRRASDDPYLTPEERRRHSERRAALRASFARLPPAERRRRVDEYKRELRPVCMSQRAFVGAWTAGFEPLLQSEGAAVPTPRAAKPTASAQPARPTAPARPQGKRPRTSKPAPRQPVSGGRGTMTKAASGASVELGAVEALLRGLDTRDLVSLRAAVASFVAQPPPGSHGAVKQGVAMIARVLASELRSRP